MFQEKFSYSVLKILFAGRGWAAFLTGASAICFCINMTLYNIYLFIISFSKNHKMFSFFPKVV